MSRGQRVITFALWGLLLAAMAFVIGVKFWPSISAKLWPPPPQSDLRVYWPAPQFSLVDQDGKTFATQDLQGRPWVAGFVFTNCAGICPRVTSTMAQLQKQLPTDVHLVSFSVDPERDTPEVLKKYAATYKADESRWHFLTGPKEKIERVAADVKLALVEGQSREEPILHSGKLVLIDGAGNVRGYYDSKEPEEMKKLAADADVLAREARRGGGGGS